MSRIRFERFLLFLKFANCVFPDNIWRDRMVGRHVKSLDKWFYLLNSQHAGSDPRVSNFAGPFWNFVVFASSVLRCMLAKMITTLSPLGFLNVA